MIIVNSSSEIGPSEPNTSSLFGWDHLLNCPGSLIVLFSFALLLTFTTPSVGDSNKLLSIQIVPDQVNLQNEGASQRFVVIGKFSDGLDRDLTRQSTLSIKNPQVATIEKKRKVLLAIAKGETLLKATIRDKVATARILIQGNNKKNSLSFEKDILSILTKHGCNSSECHGSVKGKGGFKLSLNALRPKKDHRWITQGGSYQVLTTKAGDQEVPRVNLKTPEHSLLLLKATMATTHGGGKRFKTSHPDYQKILKWISRGAIHDTSAAEHVKIKQLQVFPDIVVLKPGAKQQLLVTAHLSDGQKKDLTGEVHYQTSNPEIARVTDEGLVRGVNVGETSIMVQAPAHSAHSRIGVIARPVAKFPDVPRNNLIDDYIFEKLHKLHIIPAALATDAEFLRRVCLDITGTLPPVERVREFLSSSDPKKRDQIIDTLLNSPEYVDYWTFRFADLFRVRSVGAGPAQTVSHWEWIRQHIARNTPYDQLVRERIWSQGYNSASRFYLGGYKTRVLERVVTEDIRVFMGRRLDCAQCHDHPFDLWSQDQFWGLAAFFARMTSTELRGDRVLFDDENGEEIDFGKIPGHVLEFKKALNPRTKKEAPPTFLDGTILSEKARRDPRKSLAKLITSHPYFAEAIVNRMWSYFFKRGIVEPVDDFKWTNPPSHPRLLQALTKDFQKHKYDLKHLIRKITRSRTYQLVSTSETIQKSDIINYSHALPRALDAEILLDAISTASQIPVTFKRTNTVQAPLGTRAIQLVEPFAWPSQFLEVYGRPFRDAIPERDRQPNLRQALHILVGSTYTEDLSLKNGRISQLLKNKMSNSQIIEELYLATLSRFPTKKEKIELENLLQEKSPIVTNSFFATNSTRQKLFEDLFWALISSREFSYNH